MRIWKFTLDGGPLRSSALRLPFGAKVVAFGVQGNQYVLWVELNPTAPAEDRIFDIVGTGHEIRVGATYCGTVQDGPYVWHLYEQRRVRNTPS